MRLLSARPSHILFVLRVSRSMVPLSYSASAAVILGPADLGRYTVALAITAPIVTFADMGMRSIYLTHRSALAYSATRRVQSCSLTFALILCLVIGSLMPGYLPIILLCGAIKASESAADLSLGPGQRYYQLGTVAMPQIAANLVSTLGVAGIMFVTHHPLLPLATYLLLSVFSSQIISASRAKRILLGNEVTAQQVPWRPILVAAVPTGLAAAVANHVVTVPQYLALTAGNATNMAKLAFPLYILAAVQLASQAPYNAYLPRGARLVAERQETRALRGLARVSARLRLYTLGIGIVGVSTLYLVGGAVDPIYRPSVPAAILILLLVVTVPVTHQWNHGLTLLNRYSSKLRVNTGAVVCAALAGYVGVQAIGVEGALLGIVAGQLSRAVLAAVAVRCVLARNRS